MVEIGIGCCGSDVGSASRSLIPSFIHAATSRLDYLISSLTSPTHEREESCSLAFLKLLPTLLVRRPFPIKTLKRRREDGRAE